MPDDRDSYFKTPGVASVRWVPTTGIVLVEWEGWANSAEFAAILEAEIHALSEHRGSSLLADCRRQKVISPADTERANKEWLPRALAAGLKRFAVVVPTSGLADMNIRESLGKVSSQALEVAYFDTPDEAEEWLART